MAIETNDILIEALQQYQLLTPLQLDDLVMNLQAGFTEPADLAEDLVYRRWLTPYQAREILRGNASDLVLGQYVLVDLVGAGTMAHVFKARHRRLDRMDALKVIRPEFLGDSKALARFQREATAAARLSHTNIVTIYDANQDGNRHFIAMEYVGGFDLARLVKEAGPLSVALACDYVWQAAVGLQHAFERDMVHRDIKPSNLHLTPDFILVKILDLGLAQWQDTSPFTGEKRKERPPVVMGTPDYIAPEQTVDAYTVDIRADIYGLGCTLYYLVAGQTPFPEGSLTQKLLWHRQTEPPPVESRRPGLPAALCPIVRQMMAKRPEDRYQTPHEVAEALQPFCEEEDIRTAIQSLRQTKARLLREN
jgi:serine/threonine-protein kinase